MAVEGWMLEPVLRELLVAIRALDLRLRALERYHQASWSAASLATLADGCIAIDKLAALLAELDSPEFVKRMDAYKEKKLAEVEARWNPVHAWLVVKLKFVRATQTDYAHFRVHSAGIFSEPEPSTADFDRVLCVALEGRGQSFTEGRKSVLQQLDYNAEHWESWQELKKLVMEGRP